MKELEEYHNLKAKEWANSQLKEITELTDGKITNLEQLEKEVFDAVKPGGSLVDAYLSLHGREVVEQLRHSKASNQSTSPTSHLVSSSSRSEPSAYREMTPEENNIMRQFAQYSPGLQEDLEKGKIKIHK